MLSKNESFILAKLNVLDHVNAQMLVLFSAIGSVRGEPPILDTFFSAMRKNLKDRVLIAEKAGVEAQEVHDKMQEQLDHFADLIRFYEAKTRLQ